jgi:hypothetical protein
MMPETPLPELIQISAMKGRVFQLDRRTTISHAVTGK